MSHRDEVRRHARHVVTIRGAKPHCSGKDFRLYHGDAFHLGLRLPPQTFDAVICDPPYCSGGTTAAARQRGPQVKYCQNRDACGRPSFDGDERDQRSFLAWCTLWLTACRKASITGAYCLVFSDWRQLPIVTDAVQAGGWTWRGVIPWNKGRGARAPHKGYFRHQCEYAVWGTNGRVPRPSHGGPFAGCLFATVRQSEKHHMTGKPTELMRELVQIVPPGGLILDPFAGSATTGVAALLERRRFVGVEDSLAYCDIAARRLTAAQRGQTVERRAA
ncbi:Modification methylase DpnIIB [Maioricimonas rarisocia]|uniref:Methyltransferase n=1 Tax=Maioricimonas rarisocia TaxID=2528026 RepID=A0A517ZFP5_9PLAN|nr:DNA methyltransferase [Maioricimonas rarisocia]QDU41262.1 Modification methylase DpnIIB [Maioricimonas rarisocia]